jgi:hypothetical protein
MPDLATLDGIALRRELTRVRAQLAEAGQRAAAAAGSIGTDARNAIAPARDGILQRDWRLHQ